VQVPWVASIPWQVTQRQRIKANHKVAAKLPRWKGRLLNTFGRLTLVNSVLSSMVVYHMKVFSLSKWSIKKIDKIRRNFLWNGSEDTQRGHCLVNCQRVQMPHKLGGQGIMDLARFNRALRLRWQWLHWKNPEKPWLSLSINITGLERSLFRTCTILTIGNDNRARFWHDR
jgi:hypothetical protein